MYGKEIVQYLENYKRHDADQGHSKRLSYRDLQVTSKWKTLEKPVCFLRAVGFWPTFDWRNFGHILGNVPKLQNQHIRKSTN